MAPKSKCLRCPEAERILKKHGDDLSACQTDIKPDEKRFPLSYLWPDFGGSSTREFANADDARAFVDSLRNNTAQRAQWSKDTMEKAAQLAYPPQAKKSKKKPNSYPSLAPAALSIAGAGQFDSSSATPSATTTSRPVSASSTPGDSASQLPYLWYRPLGSITTPGDTSRSWTGSLGNAAATSAFGQTKAQNQDRDKAGATDGQAIGDGISIVNVNESPHNGNSDTESPVCTPGNRICLEQESHRQLIQPIRHMPASVLNPKTPSNTPPPQVLDKLSGYLNRDRLRADRAQHLNSASEFDHQKTSADFLRAKTKQDYHALRDSIATENNARMVLSNHFQLTIPEDVVLYEYRVTGFPDKASRPKQRVMILDMLEREADLWEARDQIATDHHSKIISSIPLHLGHSWDAAANEMRICVPNYSAGTREQPQGTPMTIFLVAEHRLNGLRAYVEGINESYQDAGSIEAINIVIAKALSGNNTDTFQAGQNRFYYRPGWKDMQGNDPETTGLICMRGYVAKVKPAMGTVLLNVNTINSAFYKAQLLQNYLDHFQKFGKFPNDPESRGSNETSTSPKLLTKAQEHLKGLRVYVNFYSSAANGHDPHIDDTHRRIKTLTSLGDFPSRQRVDIDGKSKTVSAHLKQKYRITNDNPGLSYLTGNVGKADAPNQKFYLANQLVVLSDQKYCKFPLPSSITAAMIDFARRTPMQNYNAILGEGMSSLGLQSGQPEVLRALGIHISPGMVSVPSRLIIGPQVQYANGNRNTDNNGFFVPGKAVFKNKDLGFNGRNTGNARVQFFTDAGGVTYAQYERAYFEHFTSILPHHGIQKMQALNPHRIVERVNSWNIDNLSNYLLAFQKRGVNLAVFLFGKSDSESRAHHANLRIVADQMLGLKVICMNEKNLTGSVPRRFGFSAGYKKLERDMISDYMRNIAMKLNLRCGNYNHVLAPKALHGISNHTIILGADVTHPGGGSVRGTPSIAAVVGSDDATFARFPGSMRLNPSRQEFIQDMQDMVYQRLLHWFKKNERIPNNVLFYRDGVSDSQFAKVRHWEVNAIRAAWAQLYQQKRPHPLGTPTSPSITTVVVTKRHDTRLYPRKEAAGNELTKSGNCPPGTVVDSGITSPYYFDFFLLSHNVMKGTAKPAHYFVLENEMKFTPKNLQDLTFNLCHAFGTSTSSVSYATPAYYADKLCERGRLYLQPFFKDAQQFRDRRLTERQVEQEAERVFYRPNGGQKGNPWHPDHDRKMFWM